MLPRTSKVPSLDPRSKKKSRFLDYVCRRSNLALLLLPIALLASLYAVSSDKNFTFEPRLAFYGSYNVAEGTVDGYLVWNSRCQMLSKDPLDPSIRAYVKKEKYQNCSNKPLLSGVSRDENGSVLLHLNPTDLPAGLECCWASIYRPSDEPSEQIKRPANVDSSIVVKRCERFEREARLPEDARAVMVSCTAKWKKPVYQNVHAILGVEKVRDRLRRNRTSDGPLSRKLSVLLLGIDSVSRLNFIRSAPNTERYLRETGWVRMNGYNKMGDNTFPNLMAILTGQSQAQAYSRCKPTVPHKLDQCPFIWRNFRDAGYATAYGEDETSLNTFNYLKTGFVEPPTDYYLRPYILASEKLLKTKRRFGLKYCTGPESSFDRILDYAVEFARAFLGLPYFGLFWTISASHENANGLSSMDDQLLDKMKTLEREGVLNDSMIVFLSDHGMRWGPIRSTFVGWYEERLPFLYLWLPEWFREELPDAYPSLQTNQHRLASPFDLYQTLRQVLELSGGRADPSPGCPDCHSLLEPLPRERGCSDVGVSSHWCTCTAFEPVDMDDPLVQRGAEFFLDHVERLLATYKDRKGRRLCAKLRLKKMLRADRAVDSSSYAYFYTIQVSPGDGKFEVTVRYHNGTYSVSDHDVSRINSYAIAAKCLDRGMKQYCYCLR
ncbi:uncharacterized protein LOC100875253 isoform X2 [Megachile rotundata]|uniref:uncharacterized protein LOC100875253 isoform X2 n=1 Tax=Megachile rotundata TaxID=143995 RepID=UPI003FD0BA31